MADFDAGWDAAWRFQFDRAYEASFAERLAWLEEATAIAYRTGALPRPLPTASPRPDHPRTCQRGTSRLEHATSTSAVVHQCHAPASSFSLIAHSFSADSSSQACASTPR